MIRSVLATIAIAVLTLFTTALAPGLAATAGAADAARGKLLYETRCTTCHNTSVHQSTSRRATSFDEIRKQVSRWSEQLGSSWNAGDIDDISRYLNSLYYRLPCPASSCPGGTGATATPSELVRAAAR